MSAIAPAGGAITLAGTLRDGRLAEARLDSTRPHGIAASLAGRRAEEAADLAGLLFSVCGRAHRIAARLAIRAARGADARPTAAESLALIAEEAQAMAFRHAVAWPALLGLGPDAAGLKRVRAAAERVAAEAGSALAADDLAAAFDGLVPEARAVAEGHETSAFSPTASSPTGEILRVSHELSDARIGSHDLAMIAAPAPAAIAAAVLDDRRFAEHPTAAGRPAEVGALASRPDVAARHGRGLQARLLAQVAEIGRLGARIRAVADGAAEAAGATFGPATGVAIVATSRGPLAHVFTLAGDRVADAVIVAPTEWNFHPAGPFAAAAAGPLPAGAEARTLTLLAAAFDPCVPFRLALEEQGHA